MNSLETTLEWRSAAGHDLQSRTVSQHSAADELHANHTHEFVIKLEFVLGERLQSPLRQLIAVDQLCALPTMLNVSDYALAHPPPAIVHDANAIASRTLCVSVLTLNSRSVLVWMAFEWRFQNRN